VDFARTDAFTVARSAEELSEGIDSVTRATMAWIQIGVMAGQPNPFVDIARTHNPHREVIEIALRIDGTRQPVLTQHLGAVFTTAGPATAINRDTKQGGMPLHTMLLCSVHVDRSAINDPNWLSADPSTYSRRISVRTTRATAV
jgi:hypothetical protein